MGTAELSERHEQVLADAVREYIETGEPVSSRSLVRRHWEPLSSATMRNVMADLEEAGYLAQPHTSAGRVPTADGYRYFVGRFAAQARLNSDDANWIRRELESGLTFEQAIERAGHILAKVSRGLALILAPPLGQLAVEHIRFLRVPDGRVLVVVISQSGRAFDKLVSPASAFDQEELDAVADHLNRNYSGRTVEAIREELSERLAREQDSYGQLAGRALLLCDARLLEDDAERQLYVEGTAGIIAAPEFADQGRLGELLAAIEQKRRLVELLTSCIDTPDPVSVRIGVSEMAAAGACLALISARFTARNQAMGTLGILGPLRMDYERAITTAAYLAERVSSTLSGANQP